MFSSYYMDVRGHVYPNQVNEDDVRVVVISPEDREQVERLMRTVRDGAFKAGDTYPGMGKFADAMQSALREFANPTPPKPDEPTGLGAVVEDDADRLWVRDEGLTERANVWYCHGQGASRRWDQISPVRVLSEGVTP